jgi:hypothetical protein
VTKKEKQFLEDILRWCDTPTIGAVQYEISEKGIARIETRSPRETNRLLESADYKAGWSECYGRFHEQLKWLLEGMDKLDKARKAV